MATAMIRPIGNWNNSKSDNADDMGPHSVVLAERYWQAVLAHDSSFDGSFVYAVRSTGVYCRPSCPSRRPRREQVIFYPRADAAESAGFRACRRCGKASGPQAALVSKALHALDAADEGAPTL